MVTAGVRILKSWKIADLPKPVGRMPNPDFKMGSF